MAVVAKASTNKLKAVNLEEGASHRLSTSLGPGMSAVEFVEEMPRPADAYYFPLDQDANGYAPGDTTPTLQPTIATNLAFDEDGAWVGTAVTNLWPDKTAARGWLGSSVATKEPAFVGVNRRQLALASGTVLFNTGGPANSFALTVNSWYTVSAYYRRLMSASVVNPATFALVKSAGGSTIVRSEELLSIPAIKDQWQRGFGSAYYTEAVATAWPYITYNALVAPDTAAFCGEMLEKKPFVSAYCDTSRAAGALAFNLHTSLGLNWDEDYTICYWKKPHGTSTDMVLTGFNADSIGRNSNTVGGGFRWWGKGSAALTWGISGLGASPARSSYQYKWMFVVLRRSGTTLTIRTYGLGANGLYLTQSVDDSDASPDRYVTQNNYDLQLGGFDMVNPANAYYKDLIVLKRALTDAEVDRMYATKLKMYADSIMIGTLEEGVI